MSLFLLQMCMADKQNNKQRAAGHNGDYETALFHMERAARGGNAEAQYLMGLYCMEVAMMGKLGPDPERAKYWLNKAALQGHQEAKKKLEK